MGKSLLKLALAATALTAAAAAGISHYKGSGACSRPALNPPILAPPNMEYTGFKDGYMGYPDFKTPKEPSCGMYGPCMLEMAYNDKKLLKKGQTNSTRVWVPTQARSGQKYSLIVLLHGLPPKTQHEFMPYTQDMPSIAHGLVENRVIEPVIIAAPGQTRAAGSSRTLWTKDRFDLEKFVAAVDKELADKKVGARVDYSSVSVFGFSGAGCNYHNGVPGIAAQAKQLAKKGIDLHVLGLMDTCFFGGNGAKHFSDKLKGTDTTVVSSVFHHGNWGKTKRNVPGFIRALKMKQKFPCNADRYSQCVQNDKGWQFYTAKPKALEEMFPKKGSIHRSAHYSSTLLFMEDTLKTKFRKGHREKSKVKNHTRVKKGRR